MQEAVSSIIRNCKVLASRLTPVEEFSSFCLLFVALSGEKVEIDVRQAPGTDGQLHIFISKPLIGRSICLGTPALYIAGFYH